MKLKIFFQYALTAALLVLVGATAFAQAGFNTVYDNGGKSLRGNYQLIGNQSDASYNLNLPVIDNCPSTVKWARLYWAGHAGGGDMDQVRFSGPGGLNKTVQAGGGHKESNGVVWDNADYLIYRFYFTTSDGRDLDISAELSAPVRRSAGYCRSKYFSSPSMNGGGDLTNDYAYWSGDNTGHGLESILINVKKLKRDYPGMTNIELNFYAGWFGEFVSGNMAIKAEAYRGDMMQDPSDSFNWIPTPGLGYKVGEATFPTQQGKLYGACSGNKWAYQGGVNNTTDMFHFGQFIYNPSDGRILWKKSSMAGGGQEYLGQSTAFDPTKTIVNDGTRVNDDSYYYRWADVTADLQALATAGNLNGAYTVNNIYNNVKISK